MRNNDFTFEDFINLCPYEHFDLHSGLNEDVILQFFLDLQFVLEGIRDKELNESEIFILISHDFTISIKKFLQNYNTTLGQQFQLQFIMNFLLDYGIAKTQFYAIIIAPRTHINYFKLVSDVRNINIHKLDIVSLFNNAEYDVITNRYSSILEEIDSLKEKNSVKTVQRLTY